jgi:hypothetical protein
VDRIAEPRGTRTPPAAGPSTPPVRTCLQPGGRAGLGAEKAGHSRTGCPAVIGPSGAPRRIPPSWVKRSPGVLVLFLGALGHARKWRPVGAGPTLRGASRQHARGAGASRGWSGNRPVPRGGDGGGHARVPIGTGSEVPQDYRITSRAVQPRAGTTRTRSHRTVTTTHPRHLPWVPGPKSTKEVSR